jgi:hypothetical protein
MAFPPVRSLMDEVFPMWMCSFSRFSCATRRDACAQRSKKSQRHHLVFDRLEDRWLPSTYTVTTPLDNVITPPQGSLRAAVLAAHAGDTINFASSLSGQTIFLQGALPDLSHNLTITGASVPNVSIHGNNAFRVFSISSGATVSISDLILRNGLGTLGGAIYNAGNLTLTDSVITLSTTYQTGGGGGGIFNTGTMTATGCTISYNLTYGEGGGVFNNGTMSLTNDTVVSNQGVAGGGIANSSHLTVLDLTVAGNSVNPGGFGGGIYAGAGSTLALRDSLVATNSGTTGPDISGTITTADHDLVGNGTGSNGIVNGVSGNQVGTAAHPIDPMLDVLRDNGGPTPTRALIRGSPAIDGGTSTGAPAIDQRGLRRPPNGIAPDIGSFETQPATTSTTVVAAPNPSTVNQPLAITATVTADGSNTPTGSVTFYDGGTLLGTATLDQGRATYHTQSLFAGTHSLTAAYGGSYGGDHEFAPSTSSPYMETIQASATVTTFSSSVNPSRVHHPVTFTAIVSPASIGPILPDGTVTFYDGNTILGTAPLNGASTATYTTSALSVGTHSITAHYNGGQNFLASVSAPRDQIVGPIPVVVSLTGPGAMRVNQPVALQVTITPSESTSDTPGGTATIFDNGTMLTTTPVTNGQASYVTSALAVGTHSLTARYDGDSIFAQNTSDPLAQRIRAEPVFAIGGAPGRVQVRRTSDGGLMTDFAPFGPSYTGPVSVAVGDVAGDGYQDLVVGTADTSAEVRVYDGRAISLGTFDPTHPDASLVTQFFAYAPQFNTGVNIAVGDVVGDGYGDIVTGAGLGNPHVKVFSGRAIATGTFDHNNPDGSLLAQFFAYALQFNVGANVAVGDVNGDGYADIVTGATRGNPHVKVYSGRDIATGTLQQGNPDASLLAQFFAYALQFNVGVTVAVGDTTGAGYGDIITGATIGNPEVKVYSGQAIATGHFNGSNPEASRLDDFFAYELGQNIGVSVGATDFEGQGRADIVTGATRGRPYYRVVAADSTGVEPPALHGLEGIPPNLSGGICVGA